MSLTVMEFGCLIWYIMLCCDDGVVYWDGYEVDKGFGIFMGLHVRSFYERKGE